jgi:ribosomal protein S12 methylthiotransferase accessory factor
MGTVEVTFAGGKRIDAHVGGHLVHTDQSKEAGGDGSAASPFDLFLSALATCAASSVLAFCQTRGLSTDGIRLRQHAEMNPQTKLPSHIVIELTLPASFPEPYRAGVFRAAEVCKVKKTITAAPPIDVVATDAAP